MTGTDDPMGPVGVKWNGKSTHQLRTKIERAGELGRALYLVQQQMTAAAAAAEEEVAAELVRVLDMPEVSDPHFIARSFGWDCADSPTGRCIYYTENDPMMDCCLFCENPLERK